MESMLHGDKRDSRLQPWEITILREKKGKRARQKEERRERRENNLEIKEGGRVLRKGVVNNDKC